MSIVVGLGGSRRNATAALAVDGRLTAVCAEERITRVRAVGSLNGRLPTEAVRTVVTLGDTSVEEVSRYVTGESGLRCASETGLVVIDHHQAHAASAFLTSSLTDSTVLVCDRSPTGELSVWTAGPAGLRRLELEWRGPAFATLYSEAAEALGFREREDEHKLEALARLGRTQPESRCDGLVKLGQHCLDVSPRFQSELRDWQQSNGPDVGTHTAGIAYGIQRRLGELLLELISEIRQAAPSPNICLAGGLFYNSYFNSVVQECGLYDVTFVPIDPGNPGLAAGAAMSESSASRHHAHREAVSPFLGGESGSDEIKRTLENCKLSYAFLDDGRLIERTVDALVDGHLVGWFQGQMEWGPRALGNRSILASPLSPYVAENLNAFLKHRESYRSYGVSVCEEDASLHFEGTVSSPFMGHEYHAKDPRRFAGLTPVAQAPIRVHTVGRSPAAFRRVLKAFGQRTGVPILVNTSFNGFREPIVCTPRDAVRVFYGTGLDMAVLGNFVLSK